MEYVTSTERRGIKIGMQQGVQVGSHTQAMKTALRQLQNRFGALDETVQAHVRALPLAEIEALSDALFGFATRDDFEGWLQQHPLSVSSSVVSSATENISN